MESVYGRRRVVRYDLGCGLALPHANADQMLAEAGGTLSRARFVHPWVEPEIAFLIKQPLAGRVDPMTAMAAVAGVAPALEVIDSRYEHFRFSVTDVVADNTSAAAIVVGPWSSPSTDVANLDILLEIDGAPRQTPIEKPWGQVVSYVRHNNGVLVELATSVG